MAEGYRLAGVIGWPVAHSRSPLLHGHWLRQHGIDGAYVKLAVAPGRLGPALRGLAARGFAGWNLTLPPQQAAARRVGRRAPLAARIGAVNMVTVMPDGSLEGRNTDAEGFLAALAEADPGFRAASGPAVVLGAGGASRAVVAALLDAGAPSVRLLNRTLARAEELADALGGAVEPWDWERRAAALADAALLVNTTTQGMAGQPPLELDLALLPRAALVSDIVYMPLATPLLLAARARGNRVAPGLGMLLHQARPAFAAWFGVMPEVTAALRASVEASF